MVKVIIVDNSQCDFDRIANILRNTGIAACPQTAQDCESLFLGVITFLDFGIINELRNESQKIVKDKLSEFEKDGDEIVYLINYEIEEESPGINGLSFYKSFIAGQNKKAIFIGPGCKNIASKIEGFCEINKDCSFISRRDVNFESLLVSKIQNS